jgi:hypothetical protein
VEAVLNVGAVGAQDCKIKKSPEFKMKDVFIVNPNGFVPLDGIVGPVPIFGFGAVAPLEKIRYLILNVAAVVALTLIAKLIIALLTPSAAVYLNVPPLLSYTTSPTATDELEASLTNCIARLLTAVTPTPYAAAGVGVEANAKAIPSVGVKNVCKCVVVVPRRFVAPNNSLLVTCRLKFVGGAVLPVGIAENWSPFANDITR